MRGIVVRWHWIAPVAALALVVLVTVRALAGIPCEVEVNASGPRPNIVIILFDDLDAPLADITLDGLGGVTFADAHVTSPLCCPSRVSLLTGRYAHEHGVFTNVPPDGGYSRSRDMLADRCTIPVWLQQAGYTTALIGKYLNGYGYDVPIEERPPGWDRWEAFWGTPGYAEFSMNVDGALESGGAYQTDEIRDRAVEFMGDARAPFFLFVNPYTPHRPWDPAPRHADAPAPADAPEPDRYRMMLAGRELVDHIVAAAPENTYVVITSDNGYHLEPEPGKAMPWDSDTRVPMIILGPDLRDRSDDRLVANIDLAPTIADWAGVVSPAVDGESLVPLLMDDAIEWRNSLTLEMVGDWRAERTATELRVEWSDGRQETFAPPR